MRTRPTILFFSPEACPVPALVRQWAGTNAFPLLGFSQPEEVEAIILRGHPCLLFVDGNGSVDRGLDLVRRLKLDAFTAIVPVTVLAADHHAEQVQSWFEAGADEVVTGIFSPERITVIDHNRSLKIQVNDRAPRAASAGRVSGRITLA